MQFIYELGTGDDNNESSQSKMANNQQQANQVNANNMFGAVQQVMMTPNGQQVIVQQPQQIQGQPNPQQQQQMFSVKTQNGQQVVQVSLQVIH